MTSVITVPLSKLKAARFNPVSRMRGVRDLAKSIEEVGLLYPILVNKANEVVDGHRRLAAVKNLGWDEIPAMLVNGDQATLYGHVNAYMKKHSGNEMLVCYLGNPMSVGLRMRTRLENAEEQIGRPLLERMANAGFSLATYKLACRIALEADRVTPPMLRKLVKWLMKHGTAMPLKALIGGMPATEAIKAATQNKPIQAKYAIA